MARRKRTYAEQVFREIDALNRLAGALLQAGRRAGLHQQDPFRSVPPPPEDAYHDPEHFKLAARLARPGPRPGHALRRPARSAS
jgi:hypothetical protein